MDLLKMMREDVREQQYLLQLYKNALRKLPKGKLRYRLMEGTVRYFTTDPITNKEVYIKKKDMEKVHKLKYRRLLEEAIRTIENNLQIQSLFLEKYKRYDPEACQSRLGKAYQDAPELLYQMKGRHQKRESYQNQYRQEELIHRSSFGMYFRSKSEMLIAELLHQAGIPFYYEARLVLHDENGEKRYYYPDFTIVLPDGRVIYWEHLGRMDSADYREKNYKKLTTYHFNDIYPPTNLILTMESRKGGIDIGEIRCLIENQLLPHFH